MSAIIYTAINYSVIVCGFYFSGGSLSEGLKNKPWVLVVTLLVSPVVLAFLWRWVRGWEWVQNFFPHPTHRPWDFAFKRRNRYYVVVTMLNGDKVGGLFGGGSLASNTPEPDEVFLEKVFELRLLSDGRYEFSNCKDRSEGVWIKCDAVSSIEFFNA